MIINNKQKQKILGKRKIRGNLAIVITSLFLLIQIAASIILFTIKFITKETLITTYISLSFVNVIAVISILIIFNSNKNKNAEVKKSFNDYINEAISYGGVGVIIYNQENTITWFSKYVESTFKRNLVGKNIFEISNSFFNGFQKKQKSFKFNIKKLTFSAKIDFESKIIVLKDITTLETLEKEKNNNQLAVIEFEIDNYLQIVESTNNETLFQVDLIVQNLFDDLSKKHNLTYRRNESGKYLMISNKQTLDNFIKDGFNFLDVLREFEYLQGFFLTASLGVGVGGTKIPLLFSRARQGLLSAKKRGGDQVGYILNADSPIFYGSLVESRSTESRVIVKNKAKLLHNALSNNNIKNVVIYGHKFADLDAVGSSFGFAAISRKYGKKVYIQNQTFDSTTTNYLKTVSDDLKNLFVSSSKISKLSGQTLVILTDVASIDRTENEKKIFLKIKKENAFIFDHHPISEIDDFFPDENVYINSSASSASEIVTEIIQFMPVNIKLTNEESQSLLNGIYLDTSQFQKNSEFRTFEASTFLTENGASAKISSNVLKPNDNTSAVVQKILSNVKKVVDGYYIAFLDEEVANDDISIAANEILKTSGRIASFAVAQLKNGSYKMSARGLDTNVQKIAEAVGGGGHFAAAAAVTNNKSIESFVDNITFAIINEVNLKTKNQKYGKEVK
ncbi:MAG: DHHA1 domain-containing protein [Mollicutes bacterium PWAP]|nr:DHHA1 domain-containing protein [Mollicutes bacterium PWAP]